MARNGKSIGYFRLKWEIDWMEQGYNHVSPTTESLPFARQRRCSRLECWLVTFFLQLTLLDLLGCDSDNSAACKMINLMVFHPIACVLTAIALLFNWRGTCIYKPQVGVIFAVLPWMITVVAMVVDFIVFGVSLEKSHV